MPDPLSKYKSLSEQLIKEAADKKGANPPVANTVDDQITGDPLRGPNPGNNPLNKGYTNADYVNSYLDKMKYLPATEGAINKKRMAMPYTFGTEYDQTNYLRYYNTSKYSQLGFNPYRDNEEMYNQNLTRWDEIKRATPQFFKLAWTGIKSGFRSWGDVFSGNLTSPDVKSAKEMQEAMAIGSSGKGGVMGFLINTQLNAGYTVGIGVELGLEELALAGATVASEGGTASETLPLMGARLGSAGKRISEGFEAIKNIRAQFKAMEGVGEARKFWNATKNLGKGTVNILNPFERTTKMLMNANRFDHATGLARITHSAGQFIRDVRDINLALSESKLESGMVKLDETRDLIQKFRDENGRDPLGSELTLIHDQANKAAAKTLYWNMPVILGTNKMVYELVFKGFKGVPNEMAGLSDELGNRVLFNRKGFEDPKTVFKVFEDGLKSKVKALRHFNFKRAGLGFLKTNLGEGLQESFQDAISSAAKKYYRDIYDGGNAKGAHESFYGYMADGIGEQFSTQGVETFLGGFLMGTMVGPVQQAPYWAARKVQQFNTRNDAKYQEYRSKKMEQVQKQAETLNKMYENPATYFSPRVSAMETMNHMANQQQSAAATGNQKQHEDAKDDALFEAVHTALRTNTMDIFIKRLEGMKEMTGDELKEGFGMDKDGHAKIEKALNHAKSVQNAYNKIEDMYGESPFIPDNHKRNTAPWVASMYARESWNQAKKMLLYSHFSMDRNLERRESILRDITANPDIAKAASNDFNILFHKDTVEQEIQILKREVDVLEKGTGKDKKIAKQKRARFETLQAFSEVMNPSPTRMLKEAFERVAKPVSVGSRVEVTTGEKGFATIIGEKDGKFTLDNGRTVPTGSVKAMDAADHAEDIYAEKMGEAKGIYSKYVKALAKEKSSPVYDQKIDDSFNKIKDYFWLQHESLNLSKAINTLTNPEGFLGQVRRLTDTHKELWDERTIATRKRMNNIIQRYETNTGLQELYQRGAFADPDQLEAFLEAAENKQPLPDVTAFLNISDLQPIDVTSDKYKELKEFWDTQRDLIAEDVFKEAEKVKEEQAKKEAEKKTEETTTEEKEPVVAAPGKVNPADVTRNTPWEQLPADLQAMLQPGFDKFLEREKRDNPEEYEGVNTDELREQWFHTGRDVNAILKKWRDMHAIGIPTPVPQSTVLKTVNIDTATQSGDELKSLLKTLKDRQVIAVKENEAENIQQLRKEDIALVQGAIRERERLQGAKNKLQEVMDNIRSVTNKVSIQKMNDNYLINGELYDRVTRIIEPMEREMTKKDLFKYPRLDDIRALYKKTVSEGGDIQDFGIALRALKLPEFNERKIKTLLDTVEVNPTEQTLIDIVNELAYDDSRTAGTTVDGIVRDFFVRNGNLTEKPNGISEDAFVSLLNELRALKNYFEELGLQPITESIVIFDPINKVAGEIDMLLADQEGNVYVFDVKTAREDKWVSYTNTKMFKSNLLKHQLQLSAYSNILYNGYGLITKSLGVIPFSVKYDLNGNVDSLALANKALPKDTKIFPVEYNKAIEKAIPREGTEEQATPVEKPTELELSRNKTLDEYVDADILSNPQADQTAGVKPEPGFSYQYILGPEETIRRVFGKPVEVEGFEDFQFFVYKAKGDKLYDMVFTPTGQSLFTDVQATTIEETVANTKKALDKIPNAKVTLSGLDSIIRQVRDNRFNAVEEVKPATEEPTVLKPVKGMITLDMLQDRLSKVKTLKALNKLRKDLLSKLSQGKLNVTTQVVKDLIQNRRAEVIVPTLENTKKGDVLIEKGVGAPLNRLYVIDKKGKKNIDLRLMNSNETKTVTPSELKGYEHYDEKTEISQVKKPTKDELQNVKDSQDSYTDFSTDNEKVQKLLEEAKTKDHKEIESTFINNIGCK